MYIVDKRKTREKVGPLLTEAEDLITQDMENTEVLSAIFLPARQPFRSPRSQRPR